MGTSHARKIWVWAVAGLMVASLLGACAPGPATESPATPEVAEATPTPVTPTEPTHSYSLTDALILNENPRRSSMFNIHTLAYSLPGMDDVEVINYTYALFEDGRPLTIDFYYPPDMPADAQLPAVIFGIGYRMSKEPLRNQYFYTSWGKLVAAAGMAAVIYDTEQPDQDLETVLRIIQDNAAALRLDSSQLGLMASSGNVPTVMSYLMQEGRPNFRFAIYYFGLSLTPDRKFAAEFDEICAPRGCLVNELRDVSYVDPSLPLLIVEAGLDDIPHINEGMDHFIAWAEAEGAPLTMVYFENGPHGFDSQKTEESTQIVAQTVEFMQAHFAEQE